MTAPCPTCQLPLTRRPGMFYWRGRHFHGLVCVACNSLWDDPSDSFEEHVGGGLGLGLPGVKADVANG